MANNTEYKDATAITTGESVKGKNGEAVINITRIETSGDNFKYLNAENDYLIVSKNYQFSRMNSQVWS